MAAHQEEFQRSLADPSSYWLERASDVYRYKKPHQGVDASRSPYDTWFVTAFKIVAIVDKLDDITQSLRSLGLAKENP